MGRAITSYVEPSNCITRLLTIITIFIAVQTICMSVIIYGVYTAYDRHKHDLNAIGSVPWADMASQLSEQYLAMDKNAINNILVNSKNLTHKANLLVHTKGDRIAENFHDISRKTLDNVDMIDIVRKMLQSLNSPIEELNSLLNHDNTMNIKDIINVIQELSHKMDNLELNELIHVVKQLLEKLLKDLSPETMVQISSIVHKIDSLMNNNNTKLIHDLAEDADHTVRSVNRLFTLFKPINKK